MKLIIAAALLAGSAQATGLFTTTCTRTNLCYSVPNDGGLTIDYISNATQYRRLIVSIDGDAYDSGLYNAPQGATQVATLFDAAGNSINVTLNWSIVTGTKCVQSGRVCVFPRTVTLVSGTIQ